MSGEAWRVVQAAMAEHAGDDNPSRVARNILHALRNAGFSVSRTAAPTAPSTAAGEPALVCGCGWEGSYADLNETAEGMTCPKCRLGRNLDCAAALATPPAQVSDMRQDYDYQAPDSGSVSVPADVPWEEQAARWHDKKADWNKQFAAERKGTALADTALNVANRHRCYATQLRTQLRALLSKPAKGE